MAPTRIAPMLARLARELPDGDDWIFEPKWDGFRCLAFRDGSDVDLRSRNDRALARYFPEIVEALLALPTTSFALDGELLVPGPQGFDFEALLARVHPAASRVERLRRETPALYAAFDVIAPDEPFRVRRARLERLLRHAAPPLVLTPATADRATAETWLDRFHGRGVDGVVAKPADSVYEPGKRALVKVKRTDTVDCVVAGVRLLASRPLPSSLLLGLWDGPELVHVGVASGFAEPFRHALLETLMPYVAPLAGHPWERGFLLAGGSTGRLPGAAGRWAPGMTQDWTPLGPELVAEVAYDQLDGLRFRHPARFERWRPDRDAASCAIDQLHAHAADPRGLLS